jgi:hypothetical protein
MNILDDSLSADLSQEGFISPRINNRFMNLSAYAISAGAVGILFTCSAFGSSIEKCAFSFPHIPLLKPNEAMIDDVVTYARAKSQNRRPRIGLIASFRPTLLSMPSEFPADIDVKTCFADGAMEALDQGDLLLHDKLAAIAAVELQNCDAVAIAQFSLARAASSVSNACGRPVFTTPESAVLKMRKMVEK